jgi:hypothetical protein
MTAADCEHACSHKAKEKRTDNVCSMFIDPGNCSISGQEFGGHKVFLKVARAGERTGDLLILFTYILIPSLYR